MTDITTRAGKGAPLTHDEVDQNFLNLKETADLAYDAVASIGGKANATAVGVDDAAANMGTTPGSILSDNGTAKQWFQESEAAIEARPTSAALGASAGSSLLGFLQSGTGAVARTAQDELRTTVRPEQFGAVGDGSTDDTAAVQAAVNSLSATGGTVRLLKKYRIASNLNIPAGVNLAGEYRCPRGRPSLGSGAATDYSAMGGSLRIASTATITINGSSGVSGLVVYRYGMSFPATTSSDSSGFAGTAFTVGGDDPVFENCLIMGFNKAIYSSGAGRVRINRCNFDNLNNIEITNCDDRCYISECHAWPFATIVTGQAWGDLVRSGKNIWLHDFVDWGSLINCFCYGYQRGFVIENADNCILLICAADNAFDTAPLNTDSIGIELIGGCYDTKLFACQTAAQYVAGVHVNLTAGRAAHVDGHSAWGCSLGHAILVASGDANISNGTIRNVANGISVAASGSKVGIGGMVFNDVAGTPINATVATSNISVGRNNYGNFTGSPVSDNAQAASIASADPLPVTAACDEYIVTGTTSFGSISKGWKGRRIMLRFTDVLTIFNGTGGTSNVWLAGATNFTTAANSVLYLYHNGVQWYEEGRIA